MDLEVFVPCCNDTIGEVSHSIVIRIDGVPDDDCPVDLGSPVHGNISVGELNACNQIVSYLEVLEADVSHLLCDGSVLLVHVTSEVYEVSRHWWILPVGICDVGRIVNKGLARVSRRHQLMIDSKTISPVRVSYVV